MAFAQECFWAFQTRATFRSMLLKICLRPPFSLFQKMRLLGDLAKIAINRSFGHFYSRCLRLNLLQSLQFKCILITGKCNFRQSAFRPFKGGLLFGLFLKNFPWSPLCTFSEKNAGFGWPCLNCHNMALLALLQPLFAPKCCPVFAP